MKRKYNVRTLSVLFTYYREVIKRFKDSHFFFLNTYKKEKEGLEKAQKKLMYYTKGNEFLDFIIDHNDDEYHALDGISRNHIMSMMILNVATIEKFLINLSFAIRDLEDLSHNPNGNIPVDRFTDALIAVQYIQDNIGLDFDQLVNEANEKLWARIKIVRDIRHLPAHGNYEFVLKKGKFKTYNSVFSPGNNSNYLIEKIRVVDDKLNYCRLTSNHNVVNTMNYDSLDFIKTLRNKIIPLYSKKE